MKSKNENKVYWKFAITDSLILICTIGLITSLILFNTDKDIYVNNLVQVKAYINDLRTDKDNNKVVEYKYKYSGKTYTDVKTIGYITNRHKGAKVSVLINPNKPDKIITDAPDWQYTAWMVLSITIGLIALMVRIVYSYDIYKMRYYINKNNKEKELEDKSKEQDEK